MTSAKFSGFWTPSPLCMHMGLIYIHATSLTMYIFWATPPLSADVIYGCPL